MSAAWSLCLRPPIKIHRRDRLRVQRRGSRLGTRLPADAGAARIAAKIPQLSGGLVPAYALPFVGDLPHPARQETPPSGEDSLQERRKPISETTNK